MESLIELNNQLKRFVFDASHSRFLFYKNAKQTPTLSTDEAANFHSNYEKIEPLIQLIASRLKEISFDSLEPDQKRQYYLIWFNAHHVTQSDSCGNDFVFGRRVVDDYYLTRQCRQNGYWFW
jgi:hypothetical protein